MKPDQVTDIQSQFLFSCIIFADNKLNESIVGVTRTNERASVRWWPKEKCDFVQATKELDANPRIILRTRTDEESVTVHPFGVFLDYEYCLDASSEQGDVSKLEVLLHFEAK